MAALGTIVTGVGFLGAGVIVRDGMNISGLTTAASIGSSSAMGILVGIGFDSAAMLLTVLSASLRMWASVLAKAFRTLQIQCKANHEEWCFVAIALKKNGGVPLSELAQELRRFGGVDGFSLSHARN